MAGRVTRRVHMGLTLAPDWLREARPGDVVEVEHGRFLQFAEVSVPEPEVTEADIAEAFADEHEEKLGA